MIPRKALEEPRVREEALCITPDFLRSSDRVFRYSLLGLREQEGIFVVAEGGEFVRNAPGTAERLFTAGGELYARLSTGAFTRYPQATNHMTRGYPVQDVLSYTAEDGTAATYLFAEGRLYSLPRTGEMIETVNEVGGGCAAVHRERLFAGSGNVLRYTPPLRPSAWELTEEDAGRIELQDGGGDILSLQSFAGDLYCFRTHEVLRIQADANDLNFRIEKLSFDGGAIKPHSVQNCGGAIVFLTEEGLAVCEGSRCKLVRRDVGTLPAEPHTAAHGGKYYFLATDERAGGCICVYEPSSDSLHLLKTSATMLTGSPEGVWYGHGTAIYRLTPQGFLPEEAAESSLFVHLDIADAGGTARKIDGVTVVGRGKFVLTAQAENGSAVVTATAGRRANFGKVLRGQTLTLTLGATEQTAAFKRLELHFRED